MSRRMAFLVAAAVVCSLPSLASEVTLARGGIEVVVAGDAPKAVLFAAEELTNFLSAAMCEKVPVVGSPSGARAPVFLGDCKWSRDAGVSVAGLARDGFALRVEEGRGAALPRVFIAGRDAPRQNLRSIANGKNYHALQFGEHGTVFGVYEFLRLFAGVRFYFPGKVGTVVPRCESLKLPVGEHGSAPVFTMRQVYPGSAASPDFPMTYEWLRLRFQTERLPCCHGSREFKYIERFSKTHPEYLAMKKDGTRWDDTKVFAPYQLCWSDPGFRETLYGDVKAYLSDEKPETRGLKNWGVNCVGGKWVDIMPEDSFQGCFCSRCQASYNRADPKKNYATSLMWGVTAEIGGRLIKEGVPGNITMMAYPPYRSLPDFELPTNVHVMVAETGPWSVRNEKRMRNETDEISGWAGKIGHKVWLWTYPHKFGKTAIPDIPSFAPRAWGSYFKAMSPFVAGSFCESEVDRLVFNYLNYYVFSEVAWNPAVDVEALLDEHHRKMFGRGAAEMKAFLDGLEDCWLSICGNVVDTNLGPVSKPPSEYEMATAIYTQERLAKWASLLDRAEAKAVGDEESAMRVRFFRERFFAPLAARMARVLDESSVEKELERRSRRPIHNLLRPEKWSRGGQTKEEFLDETTFVTPPNSMHVNNTVKGRENRLYLIQMMDKGENALKPNTRYRASLFVKLKDVKPCSRDGGVHFELYDGKKGFRYPSCELSGTTDWIHQSFEWTTGPDTGKGALFCLRLIYAFGEVWYDDVILEEVPQR